MNRWMARHWQPIIISAHLLIALLFSALVPPWEAYDETGHFANVRTILSTGNLPDAATQGRSTFDQAHQPPAYYLLAAAIAGWVKADDGVEPAPNYFAFDGTNRHGVRLFLRQAGESLPWRGTVLMIHLARLASVLLSTLMVLVATQIARALFTPPAQRLLASSLVAFQPQALFMGSIVNNDVLVNLTAALVIWLLLRCAATPRALSFVMLGAAVGLSIVAKRTGLSVAFAACACVLALALFQRWRFGVALARLATMAVAGVVVSAPLFASNYQRFRTLLPDRAPVEKIIVNPLLVVPGISTALQDGWIGNMLWNAFETFWGAFGWGNLKFPPLVYAAIAAVCACALVGLLLKGWRHALAERGASATKTALGTHTPEVSAPLLLIAFSLAVAVLPAYRAFAYQDRDLLAGRYLLPALPALACLIVLGFDSVIKRLNWFAGLVSASACVLSIATPLLLLQPAYAPRLIANNQGSPISTILNFDNRLSLIALNAEPIAMRDIVLNRNLNFARVHATWRVTGLFTENMALGASVLGRNNEVLGTSNNFFQGGNYPSKNWRIGDEFEDDYLVELQKTDAQLPALGRVSLAVFEPIAGAAASDGKPQVAIAAGKALDSRDTNGVPVAPIVGRFRVPDYVRETPAPGAATARSFGGIGLADALVYSSATTGVSQSGKPIAIRLTYGVLKPGNPEATAFVHALDANGKLIAQDDHAPVPGYPTDFWQAGESQTATFVITPPAAFQGRLTLVTGLYQPGIFERLPTGTANNVHILQELQINP